MCAVVSTSSTTREPHPTSEPGPARTAGRGWPGPGGRARNERAGVPVPPSGRKPGELDRGEPRGTGDGERPGPRREPGLSAGTATSLDDLGDPPGADGAATLADREPETLLHGDRLDQLDRNVGVVAGHDHLGALGEGYDAGHVRGPEVELRTVVVEERRVTAALLLRQDVDRRVEVGVRGRGARLDDDHAALAVLALRATKQEADVLTGLALVEQLAEHLDAGDRGGLLALTDTDDVDGLVDLDHTALDAAGDHGATTGDREDVLDRHEER